MECVNCGIIGHTFRDCPEAVLSYGVCAVKFIDGVPHYLLIRRRDSISYVEFLRGKYRLSNPDYIQLLINGMTTEERSRLLALPFDRLWENLWNGQNTRQFRNECEIARHAFESLKNTGDVYGRLMIRYIEDASLSSSWMEAEWGFPKGRRTLRESEIDCALREFGEETGIRSANIHIVDDEVPYVEEYTGSNSIRYKQLYFVGACKPDIYASLTHSNRVMRREVGDIGWFPFEEAYLKIRSTNPEKRALLGRIHYNIISDTSDLKARLQYALEWEST